MLNKRGYTMIEIVFVMALLALFGVTTYALVMAGADGYSRTLKNRDDNANLRIAVSFVSMKIRQNDAERSVGVTEFSDGSALSIKEYFDDAVYETLIYYYDGALYELFHEYGDDLPADAGERITDIGAFKLTELEGGGVKVEVNTSADWSGVSLDTIIGRRSA